MRSSGVMAVIRDTSNYDNTSNFIASLALICSVSCAILMLRFRGFKASLNFSSNKKLKSEYCEDVSPVYVTGAYRASNDEFFESGRLRDPPKKLTPSMVKLPKEFQPDPTDPEVTRAKSTGNLAEPVTNVATHLSTSTPDVSADPKGGKTNDRNSTDFRNSQKQDKNKIKQQKKLEQQKLADQKKKEKIEAQERVKQEKLQKERAKIEARERAKEDKLAKEREKAEAQKQAKEAKAQKHKDKNKPVQKDKKNTPVQKEIDKDKPAQKEKDNNKLSQKDRDKNKPTQKKKVNNPLARGGDIAGPSPYTTNTLDSSISKTSGPPPYDDQPIQASNPAFVHNTTSNLVQNAKDDTGNTSFGKPIETDNTWDMIAQHRQQINRKPAPGTAKQVIEAKQSGQRFYLTDNNSGVTGRKSLYV